MSPPATRQGFTLLELTMVLALLGLLFAIATPSLARARDGAAVRSAAGDVASAFAFARATALHQRAPTAIVFDTSAGVITVRAGGERALWRELRAAYGIVLGVNRDSAVYDARGVGYGISNITITIRRGAAVDTLTLSRLGRLR